MGVIILGVLIVLILSYFNINLRAVVENPNTQDNLHYVGGATVNLWNRYLKKPTLYIWQDVFLDIFWKSFINNMERIRDGQPTDIDNAAAKIKTGFK